MVVVVVSAVPLIVDVFPFWSVTVPLTGFVPVCVLLVV